MTRRICPLCDAAFYGSHEAVLDWYATHVCDRDDALQRAWDNYIRFESMMAWLCHKTPDTNEPYHEQSWQQIEGNIYW